MQGECSPAAACAKAAGAGGSVCRKEEYEDDELASPRWHNFNSIIFFHYTSLSNAFSIHSLLCTRHN